MPLNKETESNQNKIWQTKIDFLGESNRIAESTSF